MTVAVKIGLGMICLVLLAACGKDADNPPAPQAIGDDAVGHYCGMLLIEHAGSKGQIFEKGRDDPVWFASVRDALVYTRLPGEAQDVIAFYVQDMARATSWEKPQKDGIWIPAKSAYFVLGSDKRGGMGMPEAVPFGTSEAARVFAGQHGGKVMRMDEIPSDLLMSGDNSNSPTVAEKLPHKELKK